MKKLLLNAALVVAGAGAWIATSGPCGNEAVAQTATAAVGQPAPAFTLVDEAGATHSLSDYAGKIVVLEWTNPQCPFVVRHYNANTMETLHQTYGDDIVFFSVNSSHFNTAADSQAWKAAESLTWPTLLDTDGNVGRAYGARTTPHMYIIDPQGVLAYAGAIDSDPRGNQADATNYVSAAITALTAGNRPDPSSTEPYGCTVKYE